MVNYKQDRITLCMMDKDPTIDYAGNELKAYIERMTAGRTAVDLVYEEMPACLKPGFLWVGLWSSFKSAENRTLDCSSVVLPQVEDPLMDDAFCMDVREGKGFICGMNPRSVLLAVYRFLTEAGCRWVRPGKDGESIPLKEKADLTVTLVEEASYRHRGICIEGAVSHENVAELIDWMPKVGFNSYMIQFREAYNFFNKWYTHANNPMLKPEVFTVETAREYCSKLKGEIKKRGLIYHAVGHGWTCEPFGIPGLDWERKEYDIPNEILANFAEVNGKRSIWDGIPLNTNLCYSNAGVRKRVVMSALEYLKEHREVDVLHFWLADSYNNHCECEECVKMIPTDYYVKLLNELDAVLTLNGINTKVVFLIYFELLWPPETEEIKNPDRFILMFAPITRTYSKEFSSENGMMELPAYDRNKISPPKNVEDNLSFLKAWQQIFKGDSFDFDYHLMWDHYKDPGYYKISEILGKDVKNLKKIGLNGFMSCQVQRAFFPTGLPMYVLGKTLWNSSLEFEDIAREYFLGAFGDEGDQCMKYLAALSGLFDPAYLRGEKPEVNHERYESFCKIKQVINDFRPVIEKNIKNTEGCKALSWKYIEFHAKVCSQLSCALQARSVEDRKTAKEYWEKLLKVLRESEEENQAVFDLYYFIVTLANMFAP